MGSASVVSTTWSRGVPHTVSLPRGGCPRAAQVPLPSLGAISCFRAPSGGSLGWHQMLRPHRSFVPSSFSMAQPCRPPLGTRPEAQPTATTGPAAAAVQLRFPASSRPTCGSLSAWGPGSGPMSPALCSALTVIAPWPPLSSRLGPY
ncbi:uncharacterized protein PRD47_013937 [Ara ararauna]